MFFGSPCWRVRVDPPMQARTVARAWDTRFAHLLTKMPHWLRSTVEWLRHPPRWWARVGAACFFIFGGILAILPAFGLWMLPLGLALLSDDLPWLKVPLEKTARWIEHTWHRRSEERRVGKECRSR